VREEDERIDEERWPSKRRIGADVCHCRHFQDGGDQWSGQESVRHRTGIASNRQQ